MLSSEIKFGVITQAMGIWMV